MSMDLNSTKKLNDIITKTEFDDAYTGRLLALAITSFAELIDADVNVLAIERVTELKAVACALQRARGSLDSCSFIIGEMDALRKIAVKYVGEQFVITDEDVMDANCELINCVNGRLTKDVSANKKLEEEMEPPFYRLGSSIIKGEAIYAVEMVAAGAKIMYCLAFKAGVEAE